MKKYTIISCLISAGLGAVLGGDGTSVVFDSTIGHQVLNMTWFPIANHRHGIDLYVRAMDEATKPQCFPEYGIARLDETAKNIDHLHDVADTICVVQPGGCARPSHLGHSSIFFCNKLNHPIRTKCADLINSATKLSEACRFGSHYTFGYMANRTTGTDSYPYVVALGDDYAVRTL